ncbi:MAG TPA: phosphate ABC transporter permease PstA [Acidimicrobiales bacterium]|nr:phosphate ABC transporter permease PstA [Acidimicrobiales bacterium]
MGRALRNRAFFAACGVGLLLVVAPAVALVASVFAKAAPAIGTALFTSPTNGQGGGLENAILGTLLLLVGVLVVAGTIGVGAGVYLAEYAPPRVAGPLRTLSEVLAGVPSIVIGYVGYVTFLQELHWGYSLLGGVLALSVLVLPYIVKTTELAVRQVPTTLREASAALGLTRTTTVGRIVLPTAWPGVISGLIVAMAISQGETAPLLFTAGYLDQRNPSLALLHHDVPYLTYVAFTDTTLPAARAQQLASAAGAMTLVLLLALIFAGRVLARRSRRATARMAL